MKYCEEIDLNLDEDKLIELTASKDHVDVKDAALIERLLLEAGDRIDGELGGTYLTPAVTALGVLKYGAADVTRYLIYRHRPNTPMPDDVLKAYEKFMAQLRRWADPNGVPMPGGVKKQAPTDPAPTGGTVGEGERIFGRKRDRLG